MILGRTVNYRRIRNAVAAHRARAVWTPAALFAQGQQGIWYEPKPPYLFQDAAGTTPVTADGDPVGRMLDLSPNGNHATQETSAARPIYRTNGTLHWLELDGVDDYMSLGDVLNLGTQGIMQIHAHNASKVVLSGKSWAESAAQRYFLSASDTHILRGETRRADINQQVKVNQKSITSQRIARGPSGFHEIRIDKESVAKRSFTSVADIQTPGRPFWILAYPDETSTSPFMGFLHTGAWFGSIIRQGVNSDSDIASAEDYLANLAGVTL